MNVNKVAVQPAIKATKNFIPFLQESDLFFL
jgi:hypothetical protein